MGTITYNLFNLFLSSEGCTTLTDTAFAVMKTLDFIKMILELKRSVQEKLSLLLVSYHKAPPLEEDIFTH